jgi:hypothetical protein
LAFKAVCDTNRPGGTIRYVNTSQFDAPSDEVDHWTPESSWCADCWHWVIDCEHMRDPLNAEHHAVDDALIRSLAYDRKTRCLEVRYRWKTVTQYLPVTLVEARRIWRARPMNAALDELVKNRRIRFDEVRTEGKLLASLLRGWQRLVWER